MKILERDTLPPQVATEMLTRPGVRLTGKERRMYQKAREIHYVSEVVKKDPAEKLKFKLKNVKLEQLNKWHRRSERRYMKVQRQHAALEAFLAAQPESPMPTPQQLIARRNLAAVEMIGGQLESLLTGLELEADDRRARCFAANRITEDDAHV
jgi:hypothetical protein